MMEGLEEDLCGDFFSHLIRMDEDEGLSNCLLQAIPLTCPADSNNNSPFQHNPPLDLLTLNNCPTEDVWEEVGSRLHLPLDWLSLQPTPLLTPLTTLTEKKMTRMEQVSCPTISSTKRSFDEDDKACLLLRSALERGSKVKGHECNKEGFEVGFVEDSSRLLLNGGTHYTMGPPSSSQSPRWKGVEEGLDSESINFSNVDHRKERSLHHCHICTKPFKDKYSLTVHIRTHTGEKPFPCSLCPKSFRQKAHLAKHYQTHSAKGMSGCHGHGLSGKEANAKKLSMSQD